MSDFDAKHDQQGPTSEEAGARSLGRDALGLVLFAFATLLGVSVFMSVTRPAVEPHGMTAVFTALVGLLGAWPLLLLALALALMGGRIWVAGAVEGLPRHVGGALALTLAVAVLAGAASEGAGGAAGDLLGGTVTRAASAFVGVPLGLALVAAVVWGFWLRVPLSGLAALRPSRSGPPEVADADSGGLTDDEAAALLPPTEPEPEAPSSQIPEASPAPASAGLSGRSIPVSPDLKPLYPPDVRLQGQIPEGTRPLETRDQPQAKQPARSTPAAGPQAAPPEDTVLGGDESHPTHPGAVQRTAEPDADAPQRPAQPDLASPVSRWEPRPDALSEEPPVVRPLEAKPPAAEAARPLEAPATPLAPAWEAAPPAEPPAEPAAEGVAEEPLATAEPEEAGEPAAGAPPRPAWEQPGLFDEEPVDAYGTPKSLVSALRESNQEAAGRLAADSDEAAEAYAEDEDEEGLEEEEAEEVYAEEDEEPEEGEDEEEEYAEDEEELEDEEDEEAEEVYAEEDEEPEEGEDEEEEYAEDEEELEEEAEEVHAGEDEEPEPEAAEAEVVLEPKPAPRKAAASSGRGKAATPKEATPAALDPTDDLVYRAGCLFIERGRVAVSMLQREYSMDFKQATAVLDQLQEAGLIGPYLGGQRRDILLTLEEWRERRVGSS